MALKKTFTLGNGLTASDAYIRVSKVSIANKINANADVTIHVNENQIAFDTRTVPFEFSLENSNLWKQAYEHIKTLPEFVGATDC